MYDEDDFMGTQTMPWFDPGYLANPDTQGDEEVSSSLVPSCLFFTLKSCTNHKLGIANLWLVTHTAFLKRRVGNTKLCERHNDF